MTIGRGTNPNSHKPWTEERRAKMRKTQLTKGHPWRNMPSGWLRDKSVVE